MITRRAPLRHVSVKRAKALRAYTVARRAFLETRPRCEYPACRKHATEVHHKIGRGARLLDVEHWAALCSPHHRYLTAHPAEAYELGLSERRIGEAS